jgi:hypothetical protein
MDRFGLTVAARGADTEVRFLVGSTTRVVLGRSEWIDRASRRPRPPRSGRGRAAEVVRRPATVAGRALGVLP